MRKPRDYMLIFFKGLCMGAGEMLHGISASATGLMLGLYTTYIRNLRFFDNKAVEHLRHKEFAAFWKRIDGTFLLTLFGGIFSGLLLLRRLTDFFQLIHFIPFTAFLFGLVLISAGLLLRKVQRWQVKIAMTVVAGVLVSYGITLLQPIYTSHNLLFVFAAGFLASFSLVFPMATGAFILILMGKFQFIVTSFSSLNLVVIAVFCLGAAAGLWLTSRFMYKILADYYSTTVALLAGLMIGSLNRIWPWRKVFEYRTNSDGIQIPALDESIWPWNYLAMTGKDPQLFQAICMMALGIFIVVLIEKIAARLKTKL